MFKFDFDLEDAEQELKNIPYVDPHVQKAELLDADNKQTSLVVSTVEDLISHVPPLISYSPLRIPLSADKYVTLMRRDLFDARFQLISESPTAETSCDLAFIDAPSDLVPGEYEGGLKTWECSVDLAGYLNETDTTLAHHMRRILEVGCGTAIPTLYLLSRLFSAKPTKSHLEASRSTVHLQDYNLAVLQLVTLPNIILTWYASPASESYRANQTPPLPETNVSEPGELTLTPELLSGFMKSLKKYNIDFEFFSGSWTHMDVWIREHHIAYDLVLTSETIYRPSSLPSLISVLHSASINPEIVEDGTPPLELAHISLHDANQPRIRQCLVAAKVIYFGVGGGIEEFEKAVKEAGGQPRTVLERKAGVSRRIIQVVWDQVKSK